MSSLTFNVLEIPTRKVAVQLFRRDLYNPDEPTHYRSMTLYGDEFEFFNIVCRMAMNLAEDNIYLTHEARHRLNWAVRTIAGYYEDRLGYSEPEPGQPETEFTMTVRVNREHMVSVARKMSTYMPSGVWDGLRCVVLNEQYIVVVGNYHERDYR